MASFLAAPACLTFSFVNDLPGVLEALTLLFAEDVKMVPQRTQDTNFHSLVEEKGPTDQSYQKLS